MSKQKEENKYEIPLEGSLGLLALGHTGIKMWRQRKMEEGVKRGLITKEEENGKENS